MWFDSPYYPMLYAHRSEDEAQQAVQNVVGLLHLKPGARILDVGCGRGRHLWPLAELGYRVAGIDLAADRVAEARAGSAQKGIDAELFVGSMLDPLPQPPYDAVVNWFTSFGFFDELATHQLAIAHMARALTPGGALVMDFMNAAEVRANLVPEDRIEVGHVEFHVRRWIEEPFVHKSISIRDGATTREFSERVMLLDRSDFEALFAAAGLDSVQFLGYYDGSPWTPQSLRCIAIGRTFAV
jgi:cyclopropane fatty-acyl-phospholipid synthase-like methyltransferase